MKILTLDKDAFAEKCVSLGKKVVASGFKPDMIIGIRTGGGYVADNIIGVFSESDIKLEYVNVHRSGTVFKNLISPLFRLLPESLLNFMRKIESRISRGHRSNSLYDVILPDTLKEISAKRILVVDDAIDRGKTLASVLKILYEHSEQCKIRSAVITVTQPSPIVMPDYYIYNDLTLVRFPWAPDVKKNV